MFNIDPFTLDFGHIVAAVALAVSGAVHAWHAGIRRARGGVDAPIAVPLAPAPQGVDTRVRVPSPLVSGPAMNRLAETIAKLREKADDDDGDAAAPADLRGVNQRIDLFTESTGERIDTLRKELNARLDASDNRQSRLRTDIAAAGRLAGDAAAHADVLAKDLERIDAMASHAMAHAGAADERLDNLRDASGLREWQRGEREAEALHEEQAEADAEREEV